MAWGERNALGVVQDHVTHDVLITVKLTDYVWTNATRRENSKERSSDQRRTAVAPQVCNTMATVLHEPLVWGNDGTFVIVANYYHHIVIVCKADLHPLRQSTPDCSAFKAVFMDLMPHEGILPDDFPV